MQKVSIEENIKGTTNQIIEFNREILRFEGQLQLLQSLKNGGVEELEIDEEKLKALDHVIPKTSIAENIEETIKRMEDMAKEVHRLEGSLRFLKNIHEGGVEEVEVEVKEQTE